MPVFVIVEEPQHQGPELIATIDGVRWYWSKRLGTVVMAAGTRIEVFKLHKANTKVNALRMVCHRYLGATKEEE